MIWCISHVSATYDEQIIHICRELTIHVQATGCKVIETTGFYQHNNKTGGEIVTMPWQNLSLK
jgi:hypothetical protein